MTATESKSLEEILASLKDAQSVFIVGCGDCATQCQTGGEFEVSQLSQILVEHGKRVTGSVIPDATCNIPDSGRLLRKHKEEMDAADAVLVLSCGTGVQAVAESVDKPVLPGLNTVAVMAQRRMGQFAELCACCGDCIVDRYLGICPRARCPKGQTDGPCGGYDQGKCEVDKERDCVWTLIYQRAAKLGVEPDLDLVGTEASDYGKRARPHALAFEPRRG